MLIHNPGIGCTSEVFEYIDWKTKEYEIFAYKMGAGKVCDVTGGNGKI